jgi:hypothetical protein
LSGAFRAASQRRLDPPLRAEVQNSQISRGRSRRFVARDVPPGVKADRAPSPSYAPSHQVRSGPNRYPRLGTEHNSPPARGSSLGVRRRAG